MDPKDQLTLYQIFTKSMHQYSSTIWQFPSAILILNILAMDNLPHYWFVYTLMWIVNNILIYSLLKRVFIQKRFRVALEEIEDKLKNEKLIFPNFEKNKFSIFRPETSWIVAWSLFILNFLYWIPILFPSILSSSSC